MTSPPSNANIDVLSLVHASLFQVLLQVTRVAFSMHSSPHMHLSVEAECKKVAEWAY